MKQVVLFIFLNVVSACSYAQLKNLDINVEESAAVFLEEFNDEFQENFFEALKQKGIENYDRAINALLVCKKIEPANSVVDHELAKTYALDKQYSLAIDYGVASVAAEPDNFWYLATLADVLRKQGAGIEEVRDDIPFENEKLQENLALLYFKRGNYNQSLTTLKKLKKSPFSDNLKAKIQEWVAKERKNMQLRKEIRKNEITQTQAKEDPSKRYKAEIDSLIAIQNYSQLKKVSDEALEAYPSQPYFYYAQGYALNRTAKHKAAIEVLEAALDYLVGDVSLANKIYTQLGEAYNAINNSVKANMYLRKIK